MSHNGNIRLDLYLLYYLIQLIPLERYLWVSEDFSTDKTSVNWSVPGDDQVLIVSTTHDELIPPGHLRMFRSLDVSKCGGLSMLGGYSILGNQVC